MPAAKDELPEEIVNTRTECLTSLQMAMETHGTDQILSLVKTDSLTGTAFWDDFLGNGDDEPKYEDRVFSTAMAFNSLINTWTRKGSKVVVKNREGIPDNVADIMRRSY